jgi:quercetin dioxygenase-like cupin family protein
MSEYRTTTSFAADLTDLTGRQGYRVSQISPADDPSAAILKNGTKTLELRAEGSNIQMRPASEPPVMPSHGPNLEVTRLSDSPDWGDGRAGMAYRDMLPSRQGGRIIASHIRIAMQGPVDDYVHFHNICFQMIYVHKGWVRLVYEGQGEPFVMHSGDCVLQPPHIRHQVLESSAGLEVIEVGAPASHDTFGDLEMSLPTSGMDPDRDFSGQRFWVHKSATATWAQSVYQGLESTDFGLGTATAGTASVHIHRSDSPVSGNETIIGGESQLLTVLDGHVELGIGPTTEILCEGDCVLVPGDQPHRLSTTGPAKVMSVNFIGLP